MLLTGRLSGPTLKGELEEVSLFWDH